MGITSLSSILFAVVFSYIAYSIWSIAQIFVSPTCLDENKCLHSVLRDSPQLSLYIYSSEKSIPRSDADVQLVSVIRNIDYFEPWERELSLVIPGSTRNNGSLYLNLLLVPAQADRDREWSALISHKEVVLTKIPMTQLHVPDVFIFNLLKDEPDASGKKKDALLRSAKPISHLKSQVTFNILTGPLSIPLENIPGEIHNRLRHVKGMRFLPIVQYNFLETKIEHLQMMENNTHKVTLKYSPIQLGKLRFILHVEEAMVSLRKLGFSPKDLDDVKSIFAGTNLYLLCATMVICSFHLLFDFLAFKNDVNFWRNKSSMEGLSSRTVYWRAFSQSIVFLYLLDEKASMIVLAPSSIAVLIELWKVMKVIRRKTTEKSESEKRTEEYDAESMRYLSYLLYPLCIGGAIYSLFYQPHRSWWSWCIHSLVHGVYAFGFLFMLPQLFVNYRLKSVAALPWRAFMYKAFNTFIDDIFAFIITMPTSHRFACFRDDIIFLIYLYQRWLYPVDSTRLDETAKALGEAQATGDEKKTN